MAKKKALQASRSKRTIRKKIPRSLSKASRLFLPYPAFLFLMLCVGVILMLWTFDISADDIRVRGRVPAPPLIEPAVIETPVDGARFREVPVTVRGSCPLDSYVNIYRNDFFAGTALCSSDKRFELQTDLFEGANELKARVFNLTDDEGPASPTVTVFYDKTSSKPSEPSQGTIKPPSEELKQPFVISSDFKLRGFFVGQTVRWQIKVGGGTPPYAIAVDWGDGKTSLISHKEAGRLSLEHVYNKPGGERGNYIITVRGADAGDQKAYLQFFVIVNQKDVPLPSGSIIPPGNSQGYLGRELLKFIWPTYGVVLLMALSFWLGEQEELVSLRRKGRLRGRRA